MDYLNKPPYGFHRITLQFNEQEGRMRVWIYRPDQQKIKINYARYLMQIHLGRLLDPQEDVHHKDENKLNDDIDNLEVIDHRLHTSLHKFQQSFELECFHCEVKFISSMKMMNTRIKNNSNHFCSQSCRTIFQNLRKRIKVKIPLR